MLRLQTSTEKVSRFHDIIAATYAQDHDKNQLLRAWESVCIQIPLLLVTVRVQLQTAAQEVVLTRALFRQGKGNIHTLTHP